MRLGQLARKLEVKPAEIVEYIANSHKKEMNSHPNSKVDDSLVDAITSHFQPTEELPAAETVTKLTEAVKEDDLKTTNSATEEHDSNDAKKRESTSPSDEKSIQPAPEVAEFIDWDNAEHIETVKPEKLSGPKVVDKIDLPPPPPPEMIEVDGVMMEKSEYKKKKAEEHKQRKAARAKSIEAGYAKRKKPVKSEPVKNEFSFEKEKKKRDAELEKKRKKQEELIQRKRKEHYQANFSTPTVKKKKKARPHKIDHHFAEDNNQNNEPTKAVANEPQEGLLKRIWKWFNT